jgi:hypothetical protein
MIRREFRKFTAGPHMTAAPTTPPTAAAPDARRLLLHPVAWLALVTLGCVALLSLPVRLPIGPMYWDLALYVDAAGRFAEGQRPHVDFFLPVGPLSYWLFWLVSAAFPRSNPLLAAQWSPMLVTLPAMATVLWPLARRAPGLAFALLLPFLLFQLAPLNTDAQTVFPSVDGYGIYNRNASILLYALAAGLMFPPGRKRLAGLIVLLITALFLTKITGFLAGGLLCAFALAAGRVDWRQAAASALLAVLALAALEMRSGLVSDYLADIALMLSLNQGGMLPRAIGTGSANVFLLGAVTLLILAALFRDREDIIRAARRVRSEGPGALPALLDRPGLWLVAFLAAAFAYETQNVGTQGFIFLWPAMLVLLAQGWRGGQRSRMAFVALASIAAIPPVESVLARSIRAGLAQAAHAPLEHRHLGRLGLVTQHPHSLSRAREMLGIYAGHPAAFHAMARLGMLPSPTLYSDHEYQLSWLMAVDEGIAAILALESEKAVRFRTMMTLNFANPFPALMGRSAVAHIAIGADPWRAVPPPDATTTANMQAADLVLEPLCPPTVAIDALKRIYAPALAGRQPIPLGRCWIGHVRAGMLP